MRKNHELIVTQMIDYVSAHPSVTTRRLIREVPGSQHVLKTYFSRSINEFKRLLNEQGGTEAVINPPLTKNILLYEEFLERYHALGEFVRESPECSRTDISQAGLDQALDLVYGNRINKVKRDYGLSEYHASTGNRLSPEVWSRRKDGLLSFVRSHPECSRADILRRKEFTSAFSKFYGGKILPLLKELGFSDEQKARFAETYHGDAAEMVVDNHLWRRERLGLPCLLRDDLIQEAKKYIMRATRKDGRMNRRFACKASAFALGNAYARSYPFSAVKLPSQIRARDTFGNLSFLVDKALVSGFTDNVRVNAALKTFFPIPLEYRMLLEDFDEEDSDDSKRAACEYQQKSAYIPDDDKFDNLSLDTIREALNASGLSEREKAVLTMRYVSGDECKTLEETGRILKITGERVRQIEVKAIGKLRFPVNARKFGVHLGLWGPSPVDELKY